jgi:hypothetical protein
MDNISLTQIILETLALHPKVTSRELKEFVKAEEDSVMEILVNFTTKRHKPAEVDNSYVKNTKYTLGKWQLLLSKLIKVNVNPLGRNTYQLSLYGVMFVLMLVRYNDMSKLRHGLHNKDKPFLEYCDIIANNYHDTLPLIFNKWHFLKGILKTIAVYNFDIILDPEFRDMSMKKLSAFKRHPNDELHITSSNKYFFESAKSIVEISRRQLGEVQMEGIVTSRNFVELKKGDFPQESVENARKLVENKIQAVSKLLWEISVSLDPTVYDPTSFKEIEWGTSQDETLRLSQFFEIDSVERPLADEIAFLYYLNLNDEWYFHIKEPNEIEPTENIVRPVQRLLAILEGDRETKEWFSSWINNLLEYQQEILQTTRGFYGRIRT